LAAIEHGEDDLCPKQENTSHLSICLSVMRTLAKGFAFFTVHAPIICKQYVFKMSSNIIFGNLIL